MWYKGWACVINLDEHRSIGTHWIGLYVNGNNIRYFNSFGIKHFKILRWSIYDKTLLLFITCGKSESKDEKIFKEEKSIEISKILCLIKNIE